MLYPGLGQSHTKLSLPIALPGRSSAPAGIA